MEDNKAWLDSLTTGDEVIVTSRYGDSLTTVAKRTPTGRIVVNYGGSTKDFNPNGSERSSGDSYHRSYLAYPTRARKEKIEHGHLAARLGAVNWRKQPIDKLRKIIALLDAA